MEQRVLGRVIWQATQLITIGLAYFLLYTRINTLGDPGIGWHLQTGAEIWKQRAVPWSDPFGVSSNLWIHDQWLSDLLFYGVANIGRGAFRAFVALLIVAAWLWIPLRSMARQSETQPLALLFAVALTLGMGCLQWFERPVLISFLLFAVATGVCRSVAESPSAKERQLYWLPPLFALWANLHPAVFLGLVACTILLAERVLFERSRVTAAALALSVLSTLLTPYGWQLHRSAAALITNRYFLDLNWEWASPDAHERLFFPFFAAVMVLFFAAARGAFRRVPLGELSLVVLLLMMALLQRRYIPFFSLAVGPVLVVALRSLLPAARGRGEEVGSRSWVWSVFPAVALALVHAVSDQRPLELSDRFPSAEVAVLTDGSHIPGKIFHSPNWGGYLIWSSWPRWAASIDDRNQLLGVEPYERFFAINSASSGWEEQLEAGQYRYLLLEPSSPLSYAVGGRTDWAELVRGRRAVVFVKQ